MVKLLNGVKNIMTKGEVLKYEEFSHLPQCFQKSSAAEMLKSICMLKRVNNFLLNKCL